VKSILKSSGEKYKKLRAAHGDDVKLYDEVKSEIKHQDIEDTTKEENIRSLMSSIGTFDPKTQTQDDLKRISGVDSIMEQKLHQFGIYTFEQVSRITDLEYDLLDSLIGELSGSAKRDDWAGQASKLKNS